MDPKGAKNRDDFIRTFRQIIPEVVLSKLDRVDYGKVAEMMLEKKAFERLVPHFDTLADLVNTVQALPSNTARGGVEHSFDELAAHVEGLWDDGCLLFRGGRYARALFIAIVTIEELGKVAVGRMQCVFGVPTPKRLKGTPLYDHRKKHYLAACAGAVINSRLDRIVGRKLVNHFVHLAESGELETTRQSALYYEVNGKTASIPEVQIDRVEAAKFLVLSGELVVELANRLPAEFERQLDKVDIFEREIGWPELQIEATTRLTL